MARKYATMTKPDGFVGLVENIQKLPHSRHEVMRLFVEHP